jgi:hypothetical protein
MNRNMEIERTDLIIENVKINKIIFMRSGYNYFKNVTITTEKIRRSLIMLL